MTESGSTGGTMNCSVVSELLESYHAGRLNARAEESVREHLGGCTSCTVRLASLERKAKSAEYGAVLSDDAEAMDGSAAGVAGGSSRMGWFRGVPKLALIVFATALVVVPGSFWLTNSRLERDRAPTPDALPAVVAIREVGDDETRSARFGLRRPTSIQILAVGEGMDGEMYDYGWIVNTENGRTVWSMDYDDTEPAGGASKNRMVEETLTLRPGTYEVKYKTDDSHAYDDWNSDPPDDEEAWGITVTLGGAIAEARSRRPPRPIPERPTRDEVAAAVETATEIALETARIAAAEAVSSARAEIAREIRRLDSEDNRIAQLIRAEDDEDLRQRFKLERDTRVMIYALGEGTQGEMHDYAWIENAGSGRTVWRMSYEDTEHAGGAEKNRMVNETINLSAGEYILRYRTDDSHSYDDWNAQAPTDEERYGVTVLRLGR